MHYSTLHRVVSAMVMVTSCALAHAGVVTFNPITATWTNGTPSANVKTYSANTNNPLARWGGNSNSVPSDSDSGYDFLAATTPFSVVVDETLGRSDPFALGLFTHRNQPIPSGTSITGIDLLLTAGIYVDSFFVGDRTFNFHFTHNETPNAPDPCANGQANGVGVNINGCADQVRTSWLTTSDVFNVGGKQYTLNIFGFQTGSPPQSAVDFWTVERANNIAILQGELLDPPGDGEPGTIPEPTTLMLLGLGMTGVCVSRRKKRVGKV